MAEGGSWLVDPETGERRLVERTREPPALWERPVEPEPQAEPVTTPAAPAAPADPPPEE